jgi:hypothetical protein
VAEKGARPLLEAASIVAPFLLLFFVGTAGYISGAKYFSRASAVAPPGQNESPPQSDINRHRIGSILFVPWTGVTTCEERRFDNLTGRIVSDGPVDCDFLTPQVSVNPPARTTDNTVRMRAILDAFKK